MLWLAIKGAKPPVLHPIVAGWLGPAPRANACQLSQPCATLQHSIPTWRANKLLDQILRGGADANIPFSGMVQLLKRLGFQERIKATTYFSAMASPKSSTCNLIPPAD
jgi:hypothetical protein